MMGDDGCAPSGEDESSDYLETVTMTVTMTVGVKRQTLTTQEVERIAGLHHLVMRAWTKKGFIKPAVRSRGPGPGNGDEWSYPQCIGIAFAAALHASDRGAKPRFAAKMVTACGSCTEAELREWLSKLVLKDAWSEEEVASRVAQSDYTQSEVAVLRDAMRRIKAVCDVIGWDWGWQQGCGDAECDGTEKRSVSR
jgi:hypothetical protein